MARLIWNQEGQNRYESGVDHGVFYAPDGLGFVWNGLVNVEETSVGGDNASFHFDGVKFLDLVSPRNYQAKISAFSAPGVFLETVGERPIVPGFILTRQKRELFGLSYRTQVDNPKSYKIHLVYNALATPTSRNYPTMADSVTPEIQTWTIDAVPPPAESYRPSAHFILDSAVMDLETLGVFEDILYGTETANPRLPYVWEIVSISTLWEPVIIMAQPVSGLAELTPGSGDLYKQTNGLHRALPHTRLYTSPVNGIYRLE